MRVTSEFRNLTLNPVPAMKSLRSLICLAALAGSPVSAAIVYSGDVNIPIPYNFAGVYLNVVSGAVVNSQPGDFYGNPAAPWISMDFAGVDVVNGDGLFPAVTGGDQVVALPFDSPVGPLLTYVSGPSASTSHLGAGPGQITAGSPVYLGFAMNPTGGGAQYGWIEVSLNDDVTGGLVMRYAYETVIGATINAGAVPEPGTAAVVAMTGAVALLRRRRR
jgi:hypothetical protein